MIRTNQGGNMALTKEERTRLEAMDMYTLVGRAVAEWSNIELELVEILRCCLWPTLQTETRSIVLFGVRQAASLLYSATSFRAKIFMVDAAFEAVFPEQQRSSEPYKLWSTLKNRLNRLSPKRDRMAHWMPINRSTNGSPVERALYHPKEVADHFFVKHNKPMTVSDIVIAINSFSETKDDARAVSDALKLSCMLNRLFIDQANHILDSSTHFGPFL